MGEAEKVSVRPHFYLELRKHSSGLIIICETVPVMEGSQADAGGSAYRVLRACTDEHKLARLLNTLN